MEENFDKKVFVEFLKSRGNEDLLPEGYHVKYNHCNLTGFLYNDKGYYMTFPEEFIHPDII